MADSPVSRETQAPDSAARVFGPRLELAQRYAALLTERGIEWGLLGPREASRVWDRHILNCAVVAEVIDEGCRIADVGSGAGLPGIPLAIARPDVEVTLIEPLLRRSEYLSGVTSELELTNVHVRRAHAEDLDGANPFDVVTARAVAPIAKLARWTLPLVKPDGELVAIKGASVAEELTKARGELRRLGARTWSVIEVGAGIVDPPTKLAVVVRGGQP